jgi:hypothetical protein
VKRRPFEGPKSRWQSNIKMDLKDIGLDLIDKIRLPQAGGFSGHRNKQLITITRGEMFT